MRNSRGMWTLYNARNLAEDFMHHGEIGITSNVKEVYITVMKAEKAMSRKRITKLEFDAWCLAYDKATQVLKQLGYLASEVRVGK